MDSTDKLLKIYGEGCWMGYRLAEDNPYTFHHIKKKCKGGSKGIDNGAVLTLHAHRDLNVMEKRIPPYYKELNKLFMELNKTKAPPTKEYYKEVNDILRRVSRMMELSEYYEPKGEMKIYLPSWISDLFISDSCKIKKKRSIDIFRL